MEQWQFLIQKQGDRTWHPLESLTVEIMEGRYRVVACSHRANTDVDVRITHSSPPELSPQRRIYKRSRRTNADGSMAVIPFTYFQPGLWELRCSGDLMSDVLGRSWQHLVNLQVLPQRVENNSVSSLPIGEGEQAESQETTVAESGINPNTLPLLSAKSNFPIPPIPPNFTPVTTESLNPINQSVLSSVTPTTDILEEASIHTVEANPELAEKTTDQTEEEQNLPEAEIVPVLGAQIALWDEKTTLELSESTDIVAETPLELEIIPQQPSIYIEEDLSLEQPISPVWVTGETAEQILQNLVDLALPVEETLLEETVVAEIQVTDTPLPLLIHLDQQTYVGIWGQALTVMGLVQLEGVTNPSIDDTSEFESVAAGEIRLELRSPDQLQVLAEVKQPLPERLLPFAIASTVEIPHECQSKLLLADIHLYGALGGVGESQLLASQSFIITADISELLAVSMAKPSAPDIINDSITQFTQNVVNEKPAVSLDLELFNLAKTAKNSQSPNFQTSPKRAIPLEVEPVRSQRTNSRSPQLPFSAHSTGLNSHLVLGTSHPASFPYLRKLPLLPSAEETISVNLPDTLPENLDLILSVDASVEEVDDFTTPVVENHQIQTTNEHLEEITISRQSDEYHEVNLPSATIPNSFDYSYNSQLVTEGNPYVSPLIRQWMQNQGYPVPQITDFQPQNYPTPVPQTTEDIVSEVEKNAPVEDKIAPTTWVMQEIVVDDELVEEINVNENIQTSDVTQASESRDSNMNPSNRISEISLEQQTTQTLPVPQLFLPQGELVAGKLVRIRIELNQVLPNMAVKLWVEDCQSRWLLDGPHLVTDLIENHLGGMEAISEFNVPFGCIEVRVEAIALDLNTQQESHKTSLQRTVIPPDLPTLKLDEILGI